MPILDGSLVVILRYAHQDPGSGCFARTGKDALAE
jgi:hypothetical protein